MSEPTEAQLRAEQWLKKQLPNAATGVGGPMSGRPLSARIGDMPWPDRFGYIIDEMEANDEAGGFYWCLLWDMKDRIVELGAERDQLRAALTRVEETMDRLPTPSNASVIHLMASIRAVLGEQSEATP